MTTDIRPHQEKLFDTEENRVEARWKLDEGTRNAGRRGLAAVRDELNKHPGPVVKPKPSRPMPEHKRRSTAHIAKAYRNAA